MTLSDKKKIYTIILEKEVRDIIEQMAKEQQRSISGMINYALRKFIEDEQKKK